MRPGQPVEFVECSLCERTAEGTGFDLSAKGWQSATLSFGDNRPHFYCPTCWPHGDFIRAIV